MHLAISLRQVVHEPEVKGGDFSSGLQAGRVRIDLIECIMRRRPAAKTRRLVAQDTKPAASKATRDSTLAPPKRRLILRLATILVAGMCTISLKRVVTAYRIFGWRFFLPRSFKTLGLSAEDWQTDVLSTRAVVFIGGHHRSGTTLLWDRLSRHPAVSAFGSQRLTGVDFSEGAFVQDVYPTFGVGHDFERELPVRQRAALRLARHSVSSSVTWRQVAQLVAEAFVDIVGEIFFLRNPAALEGEISATSYGGLGKYALGPEAEVHWTENHSLVSAESQARILNRFGYHWTEAKLRSERTKVLLEKSPPNAVISRFLQAVINVGRCDGTKCWSPSPPRFNGVPGAAAFIFVQRHPIATSLAHLEWRDCEGMTLPQLVAHWVAVSYYMRLDAPKLERVIFVSLEQFTAQPHLILDRLWTWLGLNPLDALDNAAHGVISDPNEKYRRKYCDQYFSPANHTALISDWGDSVSRLGYDLDEWGAECELFESSDAEFLQTNN